MARTANSEALIIAELAAIKASGKPLNAPTMILCSAMPTVPDKATAASDLTEATFGGYAAVTGLSFGSGFKDVDGKYKMTAPSTTFIYTGTGGQTVVGYAIVSSDKATLHKCTRFDTPVVLSAANQGFEVQPEYAYGD